MQQENDTTKIEITGEDTHETNISEQELGDTSIDWKAKALEFEGLAKRRGTKLGKLKEKIGEYESTISTFKGTNKPQDKKTDGLDYAQKAYLKSSGINGDEFGLVEGIVKETGKDLDSVMESNYFKSELKSFRDKKAVDNAIPSTPSRSGSPVSNQVDYWMAKGHDLPPNAPENRELRGKIIEARYQREKSANQFTSNSIVEN